MPSITLEIVNPLDRETVIEVEVEFDITSAEPDVGIMSWGIEDLTVINLCDTKAFDSFESALALEKVMTEKDWGDLEEAIHSKYDPNEDTYDE